MPTSRRCSAALKAPELDDEDRLHLEFALGKAMHDAGRSDEAFAHYAAGNALRPEIPSVPTRRRSRGWSTGASRRSPPRCLPQPADAKRRTRSSSSGCRVPDRRWSSRSCRRTARSRARPSFPTCPRWRGRRGKYPASRCAMSADERREAGEEYLKRTVGPAPHRPAVFHRQAAEQLDVRAVHPSGAAKREDHRRAPPSARLLLVELSPAFRARPGLHLRP